MSAVELVREAARQPLTTDDGEPVPLQLDPPLSMAQIEALQARLPCAIPPDIRELLAFCSGFTGGATDFVDFTGVNCAFEYPEAFPYGHPIAADDGNFWVVDLFPDSREWGPIYFSCHDAPVILYQSRTLEDFLRGLFKLSLPPYESLVDDVHEDRLFDVWRRNPGVKEQAECLDAGDAELGALRSRTGTVVPDHRHAERRDRFWLLLGPVQTQYAGQAAWQPAHLRV